jgi:hypothetical protein
MVEYITSRKERERELQKSKQQKLYWIDEETTQE